MSIQRCLGSMMHAILAKGAIEGMLQVIDEQSGLAGSKVVTHTRV